MYSEREYIDIYTWVKAGSIEDNTRDRRLREENLSL